MNLVTVEKKIFWTLHYVPRVVDLTFKLFRLIQEIKYAAVSKSKNVSTGFSV